MLGPRAAMGLALDAQRRFAFSLADETSVSNSCSSIKRAPLA
jgi:hypothetical protein